MSTINVELERVKKILFIQRIKDEIDDIDEMKNDGEIDEDITNRYDIISKIYYNLTQTQKNLSTLLEDAYNNVYMKKWNRLPNYHKIQKIKEYLNEKYKNDDKKTDIEKKLIDLVQDGKLNTCKIVDYDSENKKINKITLSKKEIY